MAIRSWKRRGRENAVDERVAPGTLHLDNISLAAGRTSVRLRWSPVSSIYPVYTMYRDVQTVVSSSKFFRLSYAQVDASLAAHGGRLVRIGHKLSAVPLMPVHVVDSALLCIPRECMQSAGVTRRKSTETNGYLHQIHHYRLTANSERVFENTNYCS